MRNIENSIADRSVRDHATDAAVDMDASRQAADLFRCSCGSREFVLLATTRRTPVLLERRGYGLVFTRVDGSRAGDEDIECFRCALCTSQVDQFIYAEADGDERVQGDLGSVILAVTAEANS